MKNWTGGRLLSTLVLLGLFLAGCADVPAVLNSASVNGGQISSLIISIYSIAGVVFVVVEGLLIYAAVRYSRKGAVAATHIEGNATFEIGWTILPALVLAIVFVISLNTLINVSTQPAGTANDPPLVVKVVGHQWWWEFDYPTYSIITASEMHVPAGTVVNLDISSVDVIHSYWVPQLGGKVDAIPGHINHTWFQVAQTGTFLGQCAEFCGIEHGEMRFKVVVDTPDQFQAWVQSQKAPLPTLSGDAAAGEALFLKGACIGCHTIDGTAAKGTAGPNLTHVGGREILAGGILTNTPENLAAWLADPSAVKPGTLMPKLGLAKDQISQIVAFLESLK